MREIFTDLYKKVAGFFQAQEKEEATSNAKDVAVNRMKLVLMQDRTNLTPFLLEKMRGEMIDVLAKYVEMDKDALELNFEQEGEQMALMLSIPVLRAKEEEEIQAALEEEEKAKSLAEAEDAAKTSEEDESESAESEEESEDEEEQIEEEIQEETCSEPSEDEACESPDETEDVEEESSKKTKKRK